jgi:hypothetical protein
LRQPLHLAGRSQQPVPFIDASDVWPHQRGQSWEAPSDKNKEQPLRSINLPSEPCNQN